MKLDIVQRTMGDHDTSYDESFDSSTDGDLTMVSYPTIGLQLTAGLALRPLHQRTDPQGHRRLDF
jgi:hypothetical protein